MSCDGVACVVELSDGEDIVTKAEAGIESDLYDSPLRYTAYGLDVEELLSGGI